MNFEKSGFAVLPDIALLTVFFMCDSEEAALIPCVCSDWKDSISAFMGQLAMGKDEDEFYAEGEDGDIESEEEEEKKDQEDVEGGERADNENPGQLQGRDQEITNGTRGRVLRQANRILHQPKWTDTIVIDNGSAFMRGGLASRSEPALLFPSVRGFPTALAEKPNILIGNQLDVCLEYPLHVGDVAWRQQLADLSLSQWGDVELMWLYMLESLKVDVTEHPLIMSLPFHVAQRDGDNKAKLAAYIKEVALETFGAPAVYVADTPLLTVAAYSALYPEVSEAALVCHMGENACTVTGVVNWEELPNCFSQECALGGRNLSSQLINRIKSGGRHHSFLPTWATEPGSRNSYVQTWMAREIKKKAHCAMDKESYLACRVSDDIERKTGLRRRFTLPWSEAEHLWLDFELLDLGEAPFQPTSVLHDTPDEFRSVVEVIAASLEQAPVDLRASIRRNILLSGGTTLMPGFVARLQQELNAKLGADKGPIEVRAEWWRGNAKWVGGAALPSFPWFERQWELKK